VQGSTFELPIFVLPISGVNLILGARWLKTIGPHLPNYEFLQLQFLDQGKFITLQGDVDTFPPPAQLHHIRRMLHTNSIVEIFCMELVAPGSPPHSLLDLPPKMALELASLLQDYALVFSTPTSLPPSRTHDYTIPLVEGSAPVKVKAYRFPHSQKEEIERLIQSMLVEGVSFEIGIAIILSSPPFFISTFTPRLAHLLIFNNTFRSVWFINYCIPNSFVYRFNEKLHPYFPKLIV